MKLCGVIQSGVGKGAFFTQVDWVVKQCEALLGYKPFPGTLNVNICEADMDKIERFLATADGELLPDDSKFCAAKVKKITVNALSAAVVLPSEDVRVHENRVLEIIAAQNLKQALGLEDGSEVILSDFQMDISYKDVYEFAASAGAFEGYVYQKEMLDAASLNNWVANLVKQYRTLPEAVIADIQAPLDRTLGRAVQSLIQLFGEDHVHVIALRGLIAGPIPAAADDFDREKKEKAERF